MIKRLATSDTGVINPYWVAVAVSLATFMEVLDTTITNVSLSHIAGSLGASPDESTWVLTSYLVANGIVLPIAGWLAGVLGRKRFFLICIAGFTAASFACGAATSLPMLIFFRLMQGIFGGGLQPIQQAIIMDAFPPEKRAAAFGLTGITIIAAPVIGPTLGGYITDSFDWRWIFYLNIPIGLIAIALVSALVHDPDHAKAHGMKKPDYIGLGLVALGLGTLQVMLDKGQQEDWFSSSFIVVCGIIAVSALITAVFWLLRQKDPIIQIRLLGTRTFGLCCISIFTVGLALYSGSAMLPLVTQSQFGYNATLAGLVISPGALFLLFLMPMSGKLVGKIQPRYMVTFGFAMSAIGMWMTAHITPQTDFTTFVIMRIVQVIGLPFLFIPVSTMAFADIPKELGSKASSLFALSRNMGGSIGIAVVISYVMHHTQKHQAEMVTHLSPSNPNYQSLMATYESAAQNAGMIGMQGTQTANTMIYQEVLHQSAILGYADGFILVAYIMAALAIATLLFMPDMKRGATVPVDAH
ncbi:MAG TPA: DHA2 family efflux MFS transporter permease subunit [Alphaproteobacteria bacterium]